MGHLITEFGEKTLIFLGKKIIIFDFIVAITLIVVGLVWLISLFIFLLNKRKRLKKFTQNDVEKQEFMKNDQIKSKRSKKFILENEDGLRK